jgi:hypothetical protein
MSFGRNPHVSKAQAAEQKARDASDDIARTAAWREAARLWERAAEREDNDKRRLAYEAHAEAARTQADADFPEFPAAAADTSASSAAGPAGSQGLDAADAPESAESPKDRLTKETRPHWLN